MHVFEELASKHKMLCPETRAPVEIRAGRIVSPSGRDFGGARGPLNFLSDCEETIDSSRVPPGDVERVRRHLELPAGSEVDSQIARAIASTGARFGQEHLSAEARILAERFHIPGFELGVRHEEKHALRGSLFGTLGRFLQRSPVEARLQHVSDSVGPRLTAGQPVYRSVRVRNAGNAAVPASDASNAHVKTWWTSADGSALVGPSVVNDIPVEIVPGREITLILQLIPPSDPGAFRLHAQVAVEGGAAGEPFFGAQVEITRCDQPVFEYSYWPAILEYAADHHVAMLELVEHLKQAFPERPASVLEIGGGVHPSGHALAAMGHRVVSSDISHSQSILGTLYFQHRMPQLDETLAFLSCDGSDLPFADGAFDGVMFFAAFHHFADPPSLLKEVSRVIARDGFVFIGCDNCAPAPADATYREELRRGINEQVWTLAEYTAFFREAGLAVARARVDHHSLKVVLTKPR